MKNKFYYVLLFALGVSFFICAYMLTTCKRELEILPGLKWEYYTDNYARLTWDKVGVVATGRFDLVFSDYGLCVFSSNEKDSCYLDLREQRIKNISDAGTNLWDKVGVVFGIDASTAMGVRSEADKESFGQALMSLKKRLRYDD